MPLTGFGAILSFAEEIEVRDREFYLALAENPNCARHGDLLRRLAKEAAQNVQTVRRIRRENVTEMILEPIRDFERRAFAAAPPDPAGVGADEAVEECRVIEERAARYYREASEKIKALPEAARGLALLGKRRAKNLDLLSGARG